MQFSSETIEKIKIVLDFARTNEFSNVYQTIPNLPKEVEAFGDYWMKLPLTKHDDFLKYSPFELMHYKEEECRFLVSQYETISSKEFFMFPQRIDDEWQLIDSILKKHKPLSAVSVFPAYWQLAPMFYKTCRKNKTPMAALRHTNHPLTANVVKEMQAELIVTTPEAANGLLPELKKIGIENLVKHWVLMVPFGQKVTQLELPGEIFIEHHVFPGVSVGVLKEQIDSQIFLQNYSDFYPEVSDSGEVLSYTSLVNHAFPLIRYAPEVREVKVLGTFEF